MNSITKESYKNTEIGVIPVEWDIVGFKSFFSSVGSKKYQVQKSKYLKSGKYPIIDQGQKFIVGYSDEEEKVYKNLDGVVVFGDHTRIIKFIDFDFVIGADGTQLLKSIDGINQIFSYYVISNKELINLGYSRHFKLVKEMKFPLPPLKEQEKIANILSTADDKISAIASQIEKAQTLKKGLLQKLLSEGIGHSEFKDSGLSIVYPIRRIPKKWNLQTLSDITTKITDGAHFTPTYVEKGVPFLRVTDLKSKDLLSSGIKYIPKDEHLELLQRCNPEKSDILYSKNGTIGLTRIVNWDWEFSIFVSLCLIKPRKDLIIPEYLKYYLTSSIVNTQIKIRAKQGTITNLHLEEIREFFITIPPLEEQKQIAEILSTADEKLEVLKDKKEKYETLKKGLLQKLLSGEIRVLL